MHFRDAAGGWLSQFPGQVVAESRAGRVGSETMLTRMAELMFVEVVRRYVEELPLQHTGWLAGLRDAVVGAALSALHERPAYPWTLASLARRTRRRRARSSSSDSRIWSASRQCCIWRDGGYSLPPSSSRRARRKWRRSGRKWATSRRQRSAVRSSARPDCRRRLGGERALAILRHAQFARNIRRVNSTRNFMTTGYRISRTRARSGRRSPSRIFRRVWRGIAMFWIRRDRAARARGCLARHLLKAGTVESCSARMTARRERIA